MATTTQVGPPTPARLPPLVIVLPASAAAMMAAADGGGCDLTVGSPGGSAGSGATAGPGAAAPLAEAEACGLPGWADAAAALMTGTGPVGAGGAGLLVEDGLW